MAFCAAQGAEAALPTPSFGDLTGVALSLCVCGGGGGMDAESGCWLVLPGVYTGVQEEMVCIVCPQTVGKRIFWMVRVGQLFLS